MNWNTNQTWPNNQSSNNADVSLDKPWPNPNTIIPPSLNPLDQLSQDQLLVKWQETKDAIEVAKAAEMTMRKYIVSRAFPNATEGTNTVELGAGYSLKAVKKFNYNLDTDLEKVEQALDDIAKMGNEGTFLAERLVKFEAKFLLTEYRKLCTDDATDIQKKIKKRIDQVLTITDASPNLEIKGPKIKK